MDDLEFITKKLHGFAKEGKRKTLLSLSEIKSRAAQKGNFNSGRFYMFSKEAASGGINETIKNMADFIIENDLQNNPKASTIYLDIAQLFCSDVIRNLPLPSHILTDPAVKRIQNEYEDLKNELYEEIALCAASISRSIYSNSKGVTTVNQKFENANVANVKGSTYVTIQQGRDNLNQNTQFDANGFNLLLQEVKKHVSDNHSEFSNADKASINSQIESIEVQLATSPTNYEKIKILGKGFATFLGAVSSGIKITEFVDRFHNFLPN